MCGIAGIIAPASSALDAPIAAMTGRMAHRGPNHRAWRVDRIGAHAIALGHARLSIIDLSHAADQPLVHPRTGAVLVFNGEIYNYRALRDELSAAGAVFEGHGDSEVLLEALVRWGPAALDRLLGMYAFALVDPATRTLLLARDPMGIKPLYVAERVGTILFASEVRALLESGMIDRRIDRAGLATCLAYGAVQEPATLVQGVRSFPAGAVQEIDLGGAELAAGDAHCFWRPPEPRPCDPAATVREYREVFQHVVEQHLLSDVPLAVLLSAGLDSTVIAALAARSTPRLRSFTVSVAEDAALDESGPAERTAAALNLEHTALQVSVDECAQLCRRWLRDMDQPSIDGLNVYVICRTIAAQQVVVVLSGLGGDELFGGYWSFTAAPRLARWMRRLRAVPAPIRASLAHQATRGRSVAEREKIADLIGGESDIVSLCLHLRRSISDRQLRALGLCAEQLGLHPLFVPHDALEALRPGDDAAWVVSQAESRFYQANMLLRNADGNSMAHSLELRVPFLDRRMLDFAFSIPHDVRLPAGIANKHLTREAFADVLRPELLDVRKRGFVLPIHHWVRGPLQGLCREGLDQLLACDVVETAAVEKLWDRFRREPQSLLWSRIWSLAIVGTWLEQQGLRG